MTGIDPSNSETWVSKFVDGGLPQLLAGPAGNALSRLLGAIVDIPAAYLHGFAQHANDKTEARTYISQQIAKRVAELAIGDPKVMDRAINSMLLRSYRAQENKDAIAFVAIDDLQAKPPTDNGSGPSDSWIMKLERYAEDASSEDLQMMFGKLLAGEIRNPGSISLSTLHFVSMLDNETAQLIEKALSFYIMNGACLIDFAQKDFTITEKSHLEDIGFWNTEKFLDVKIGPDGNYGFHAGVEGMGVAITGSPGTEDRFDLGLVSKPGKDLAKIVKKEFDINSFYKSIAGRGHFSAVYYGKFPENGEDFLIDKLEKIGAIDN